jgi:hypothetical protein
MQFRWLAFSSESLKHPKQRKSARVQQTTTERFTFISHPNILQK